MTRREIFDKLAAEKPALQSLGVRSLSLFGSAATDQMSSTSDLDFVVEFDDRRPIGLFELARLQRRLQEILSVEHVDLVTLSGIHPALRERILAEAVRAA